MRASSVDSGIRYSLSTVGIVWSAISQHVGGGELLTTEGMSDEIAAFLDTTVSIDGIFRVSNGAYKGLAYRVQKVYEGKPYCTHTIRWAVKSGCNTERHKLMAAYMEDGAIGPALHVQAYFSTRAPTTEFICAAAVPTRQLVELMIKCPSAFKKMRVPDGGNTLGYVSWVEMMDRGLKVVVCGAGGEIMHPCDWPDTWQNRPWWMLEKKQHKAQKRLVLVS